MKSQRKPPDFLDEGPVAIPPAMSEPEVVAAPVMSEPEILAMPAPEPASAAPVYEALAEAAEPESIR